MDAVFKSDSAKTYGIDATLKPIVAELKDIEHNSVQGEDTIEVEQLVGDNSGLNAILGYNESFSANSVCRWCRIHKEALWKQTQEDASLLQTAENYNHDLELRNSSETGLKRVLHKGATYRPAITQYFNKLFIFLSCVLLRFQGIIFPHKPRYFIKWKTMANQLPPNW